ncbi:MAG: tyrosine-type recombinase/integrase [Candidatus Dormiibacterota bacterium]
MVECNLPNLGSAIALPMAELRLSSPVEVAGSSQAAATEQPAVSLDSLWQSYRRSLVARRRAPGTVARYEVAIRFWHDYCVTQGWPTAPSEWSRPNLEAYVVHLLATCAPATAAGHYRVLRTYCSWLVEEEELDASPMQRMHAPSVPLTPPPVVDSDTLERLLTACKGRGLEERRDMAIVLLLASTGMRRGELVGLRLQDVDIEQGIATVTGKTGTRVVPLTAAVCVAIDRYMRVRASHRRAALPALLLGHFGVMTGGGVRQALQRRAAMAGISTRLYPHLLRHSATHAKLAAGMSELDVCSILGWSSASMLQRYGASMRTERALASYRRLFA